MPPSLPTPARPALASVSALFLFSSALTSHAQASPVSDAADNNDDTTIETITVTADRDESLSADYIRFRIRHSAIRR